MKNNKRKTENDEENANKQEARNKFKRSAATNKEQFGFGHFCRFSWFYPAQTTWTFLLDTFALLLLYS
jgi:hypothetical protein